MQVCARLLRVVVVGDCSPQQSAFNACLCVCERIVRVYACVRATCLEEPSRRRGGRRIRSAAVAAESGRMFLSGHCACVRLERGQGRLQARRRFCEENNNNAEKKNIIKKKNWPGRRSEVVARNFLRTAIPAGPDAYFRTLTVHSRIHCPRTTAAW